MVPTDVEFTVTASGEHVTGHGSFGVASRIRQQGEPNWQDPASPTMTATVPAIKYVGGDPLRAPYPGIVPSDTGTVLIPGLWATTFLAIPTKSGAVWPGLVRT